MQYSSTETKNKIDFEVTKMASGEYFIQIATGDNISRQKFIRQ